LRLQLRRQQGLAGTNMMACNRGCASPPRSGLVRRLAGLLPGAGHRGKRSSEPAGPSPSIPGAPTVEACSPMGDAQGQPGSVCPGRERRRAARPLPLRFAPTCHGWPGSPSGPARPKPKPLPTFGKVDAHWRWIRRLRLWNLGLLATSWSRLLEEEPGAIHQFQEFQHSKTQQTQRFASVSCSTIRLRNSSGQTKQARSTSSLGKQQASHSNSLLTTTGLSPENRAWRFHGQRRLTSRNRHAPPHGAGWKVWATGPGRGEKPWQRNALRGNHGREQGYSDLKSFGCCQ